MEAANDTKAMCEALETILNLAYEVQDANSECGPKISIPAQFLIDEAKSALSAPLRNCNVGTVAEQTERFKAFCQRNMQFYSDMFGHDDEGRQDGWDCREDCPIGRMIDSGIAVADHCELAWAQMPYEEREEEEGEVKND